MMTILLALAELEAGRAGEIFRRAQAHAVMRGIHVTGRVPLGYQRDDTDRLALVPQQVAPLKAAFIQRGFGALPGEIAETLRQAGTMFDGDRDRITLRKVNYLLRNPVYTGEARCGDCINPTAHPPLGQPLPLLAAQDPRTRTTFNRNVKTLLAGLVRCGACGGPVHIRRPSPQRRVCRCTNRGGRCTGPVRIEAASLDRSSSGDSSAGMPTSTQSRRSSGWRSWKPPVAADTAYGQTLAHSHSEAEVVAARQASEQTWRQLSLAARLALALELPDPAALRRHWKALTVTQQRHILAVAIATVTVHSTTGTARPLPRVRIAFAGGYGA